MRVPRVWVSDTATRFKNRVIAQLSDALKVDHRFAVAYTRGPMVLVNAW